MFSPPDYGAAENYLNPGLGPWTVVLYMHRRAILNSLQKAAPLLTGRLLDVGCGNKPYLSIIKCDEYVGVDVSESLHNHDKFDFIFDGKSLPFENNRFDSVLCTEVLEHCENAEQLMFEMNRVLKPGGFLFFTVPMFIEHHEAPFDLRRFTYYGAKKLAEQNGLEVVHAEDRGNFLSVFIAALYIGIGQFISRRPFSDIIYWILFPFTWVVLKLDKIKRRNPVIISPGWQFLVKKSGGE
jgi:SAM-dependent methyltransferase